MVSNTTTSPAAVPANKLSIADLLALACAIVLLIAFAALPWMSNHTENSEPKTGLSLLGSMALAGAYATGNLMDASWKLDIPTMATWHGTLNAFGFALCGLLAWTRAGVPAPPD